jgi:FkbM family methyltransferase
MDRKLVFDIGFHRGEDADFYLKKGFRVVGVEANAELCETAAERFHDEIESGQLVIVNRAVAKEPGRLPFYVNTERSVWGTANAEWAERNRRLGTESIEREVEGITMCALLEQFGVPYYAKIDIEGNDLIALEGLAAAPTRPKYISVESDKDSFRALRREFATMQALGYDAFKIVDQSRVRGRSAPSPTKEGRDVAHRFRGTASGPFGEDLPGRWLSADEAVEAYRPIFFKYALSGDDGYLRSKLLLSVLRRTPLGASWHDTHARLGGGADSAGARLIGEGLCCAGGGTDGVATEPRGATAGGTTKRPRAASKGEDFMTREENCHGELAG